MALDQTTETIAHFAGLFQASLEAARLQHLYDGFEITPDGSPDKDIHPPPPVELDAPHALKGYDPGLTYTPALRTPDGPPPAAHYDPAPPGTAPGTSSLEIVVSEVRTEAPPGPGPVRIANEVEVVGEPAGSIATTTIQTARLSDDDIWVDAGVAAVDTAPLHDMLVTLQGAAAILSPVNAVLAELGADWSAIATAVRDLADGALKEGSITGPSPQAGSIEIVRADDAAIIGITVDGAPADALPDLEALLPAYHLAKDETTSAGMARDREDAEPQIVTGGNLATNEASISLSGFDASLFVVGGDVHKLDFVSQINAIDAGAGDVAAARATNMAEVAARHDPQASPGADTLPAHWAVTHIPGDLVATNHVIQDSFATDFDRIDATLTATETYAVLGGNQIVNTANFLEHGQTYDLAVIGGDLIDIDIVTQTNVLLDDDRIDGAGGIADLGDNLLHNQVAIRETGIDTIVDMTRDIADAARDLAAGAKTIAAEAAQNAIFAGTELLRVLHVEGDFTTVNVVEQSNVVGDTDQIRTRLDGLAEGIEAKIVAGSNALVNTATIERDGIDSTIMAAGAVYDTATLFQAELIDTGDSDPQALASEAVAFLADGLIEPASVTPEATPWAGGLMTNDADVMGSVLT